MTLALRALGIGSVFLGRLAFEKAKSETSTRSVFLSTRESFCPLSFQQLRLFPSRVSLLDRPYEPCRFFSSIPKQLEESVFDKKVLKILIRSERPLPEARRE